MTETVGVVDPRDAKIAELQAQLAEATKPKPSPWAGVKAKAAKIANGILAAVTSSEAVKAEKSLAALAIARLLLFAGAGAATTDGVYKLLHALGWT